MCLKQVGTGDQKTEKTHALIWTFPFTLNLCKTKGLFCWEHSSSVCSSDGSVTWQRRLPWWRLCYMKCTIHTQIHLFTWTDPHSLPARSPMRFHGNSHSQAVFLASSSGDTHLFCSFPSPGFEGNLVPVKWEDLGFVVPGVSLWAELTGDSDRTWGWWRQHQFV